MNHPIPKSAFFTYKEKVFSLSGRINIENVMFILKNSMQHFAKYPENKIVIHLNEVQSCDSSGLALIIEWLKYAKLHNKEIYLHHFPKELGSISKAAKLDILLADHLVR